MGRGEQGHGIRPLVLLFARVHVRDPLLHAQYLCQSGPIAISREFRGSAQAAILNSDGTFSGSTTVVGVFPVTITATNSNTPNATQMFTLTVRAAAPAQLLFGQQPTTTTAGTTITPPVTVRVQDAYGNAVPTAGIAVTLALGMNPGMETLAGTLTQTTDATGLATFGNLSINKAAVGYTLSAASGALTGATSAMFTITPGAPVSLQVTGIPSSVALGATVSVMVTARDNFGNIATDYTGTVHVTSSDTTATLPGNYTFVAGDGGCTPSRTG